MINTLIQAAKIWFKDAVSDKPQIDSWLFPTLNESTAPTINMDAIAGQPFAARHVSKGGQARVKKYEPGDGFQFTPVPSKEKTPVDDHLDDSVIAGVESNASYEEHATALREQIITGPKGHVMGHRLKRNYVSMAVMRTGKCSLTDEEGNVKELDFDRDGTLDATYDFTAAGATFDLAVRQQYNLMKAKGCPTGELCMLIGGDYLNKFDSDEAIQKKRSANTAALMIEDNRRNSEPSVEGLRLVASKYVADGVSVGIDIYTYEPQYPFQMEGMDKPIDYLLSNEMIMFAKNSMRSKCNRGITVKENGVKTRKVSDVVVYDYTTDDPVVDWIVSATNYAYIPGNINHTSRQTGGF